MECTFDTTQPTAVSMNDMTMISIHEDEDTYPKNGTTQSLHLDTGIALEQNIAREDIVPAGGTLLESAEIDVDPSVSGGELMEGPRLNDTFERSPTATDTLNRTFDKEESELECAEHQVTLDLVLDSTSQTADYTVLPDLDDAESPADKQRSFLLKRRSSTADLCGISPKRKNSQNTPRVSRRRSTNLLEDSIAFDFSSTAKSAELNGGYAKLGSYLFSSESGLHFKEEPLNNSMPAPKMAKDGLTRFSIIAMFDPLDRGEQTARKSIAALKSTPPKTPLKLEQTLLVKGLPEFNHPDGAAPPPTRESSRSGIPNSDRVTAAEVEAELIDLNETVRKNTVALRCYEQIIPILRARIGKGEPSRETEKSRTELAHEREAHQICTSYCKTMEESAKIILKQMNSHRDANSSLRDIVQHQQKTLNAVQEALQRNSKELDTMVLVNEKLNERVGFCEKKNGIYEETIALQKKQIVALESQINVLTDTRVSIAEEDREL